MRHVARPALFLVLASMLAPSCEGSTREPAEEAGPQDASDAATDVGADVDAATDVSAPSCLRTDGAFTACVKQCGEPDDKESMSAACTDGTWRCPAPLVPAATCAPNSWPSGPFAGCGPWVNGYDCTCPARCVDGAWTCPGCGD
jgi:hypothetical protein